MAESSFAAWLTAIIIGIALLLVGLIALFTWQQMWPEVGACVGVFRMEGRGVQLFNTIEGSHFTILGMPLLPLLLALRERGLLTQ